MPIYAIWEYVDEIDDFNGPVCYIQADNTEEIEEVYPRIYYYAKEVQVETVNLIKIKRQMQYG